MILIITTLIVLVKKIQQKFFQKMILEKLIHLLLQKVSQL
jgi:hypothetical protein